MNDSVGEIKTVLVVEDQPDMRRAAVAMMRNLGFATLEAEDGPTALQIVETYSHTIALIFSDVMMPGGIDGFELAQQVNHPWPEIKILLTSGGYTKSVASASRTRAGGFLLLPKPYDQTGLSEAVARVLDE
jgi:CheY-like chemotaxis protein